MGQSIHMGLDAAKSINIGDLNEKICGVNTEGCDPICGGAGCEFCGAKEGEELASPCQGSATQAAQAKAMAQKAKDSLSEKLKSSGTMLKKVKSANEKVEDAQEKVSEAHSLAEKLNKRIGGKNQEIKRIIEKIKIFLMEKRDDPDIILAVSQSVLKIPIPTEGQVDYVVENDQLASIISLSETGNHKAKKWIDASERARKIKEKSDDLRRKVQNHIEVLEDLEKDFRTNQQSLAGKRKELESLKKEAPLLRKQLRAKLAYYQTKCGGNKG